jgi:hypothetical protein
MVTWMVAQALVSVRFRTLVRSGGFTNTGLQFTYEILALFNVS